MPNKPWHEKHMHENQHNAWIAVSELEDYFSRLGGAARPRNMTVSEIPLYIGCKIIELHDNTFNLMKYLDIDFLEAAAPVLEKANATLSNLSLQLSEVLVFVSEFYRHFDSNLKSKDKTAKWEAFGSYLGVKNE